jgi:hypothetical protein
MDYPRSYADVLSWFPDDAACLDYLEWLRWPDGFVCPNCEARKGWRLRDGRWSCAGCARKVSVTAGTIFHGTRTPLTVWFAAAWQVTSQKNGTSALGLKRVLGLGSEQTAWAMLHRYRTAMGRTSTDLLSGDVEVDETFFGGPEPGRSGRGALGKTMVAVAVERRFSTGRCRMAVIEDAGWRASGRSRRSRRRGERRDDGWPRTRRPRIATARRHVILNRLRRDHLPGPSDSLAKRWLLGTTRAASSRGTCRPTSTSSRSASTAVGRGRAVSCSTGCSRARSSRARARIARWSSGTRPRE